MRVPNDRCDFVRFHPGWHMHRYSKHASKSWGPYADRYSTYDTEQPWILYTYLTTDRRTRFTGISKIKIDCLICGSEEIMRIPIPRLGQVAQPEGGQHPIRRVIKAEHRHPEKNRNPLTWAKPLANLSVWQ